MTHAEAVARWIKVDGIGVEIGAGRTPVPGIKPFYVDRFSEFGGAPCIADFWGDACHLPFRSDSLDYVVSSHVLEHVANPVAALLEWHRVLRDGGVFYLVVPDRRFTFDHARALTDPAHMWGDFERGVNQSDGTHSDEFVDQVDWALYRPDLAPECIAEERETLRGHFHVAAYGGEINIHFHVFEPSNLQGFFELVARRRRLDWEKLILQDRFPDDCPNGILLVVRVHKHGRLARWRSAFHRSRSRANPRRVVRRNAPPISADATMRRNH